MTSDPIAETMQRLIRRVCGEFMEMPGLRLTAAQAQRLWGLDEPTCTNLLHFLVDARFLQVTGDGCFARLTDGVFAVSALGRAGQGANRSEVRDTADTPRVLRGVRRTRSIP
jgi:hypothetical protein